MDLVEMKESTGPSITYQNHGNPSNPTMHIAGFEDPNTITIEDLRGPAASFWVGKPHSAT